MFKRKDNYTNKLFARNATLASTPSGDTLQVDFSHYPKKKRNNLEDEDYDRLVMQQGEISHFIIGDETIINALEGKTIVAVTIVLSESSSVSVPVSTLDRVSGILR